MRRSKGECNVRAVDFFCGAGGLTHGLKNAGVEVVLGIDSNGQYRKTYERNNAPARFLCRDIRTFTPRDLEYELDDGVDSPLLFAACAPCQPFSKQRTDPKDTRQRTLLGEVLRFVEYFRPEYLLFENVPGIAKVAGNSTFHRVVTTLSRMGYAIDAGAVDAKSFGVPQTRRRYIIMGSRIGPMKLPKPECGPGLKPYVTVRRTIAKYPPIGAGETHRRVPNHRASVLSARNLRRIAETPRNGGDRRDWPSELVLPCHSGEYEGHTDVYGRMWWDRPAPALTCKCHSLSNGRYGHPEQNRAISLREAAALQTFPDSYVFYGSSKACVGEQIGNAVPVRLAEALGRSIVRDCTRAQVGEAQSLVVSRERLR
jgi:DNA (cytosine-5)-methyltransferase 1